jgi:UDP-N-acetylglucosamine acyltransferase
MTGLIDARAVIHPSARLAPGVSVGPYSVIGADVEIGAGTWIGPHVVINGPTRIGIDNKILQFASLGEMPQDKKYAGEPTRLEIGDRNVIREFVTISRGTVQDGGVTRVGNDNWIMAYVHIAHDCQVGDHVIFSNSASLAGHVHVQDRAILGGFTLVHQFCHIGAHCFTAMNSVISMDVPPYMLVSGHMAKPHGLNVEGLKRRGFSAETLQALRRAYKVIYRSKLTLAQAIEQLKINAAQTSEVTVLVEFLEQSTRGIVR